MYVRATQITSALLLKNNPASYIYIDYTRNGMNHFGESDDDDSEEEEEGTSDSFQELLTIYRWRHSRVFIF
jgi:hypothetical protein